MVGHSGSPRWIGSFLANLIRRRMEDPGRLLTPFVHPGMTVLEPGPGMGFFTLEIARLVGSSGRVIAVDVAPRMIDGLRRRARKTKLADRIDARLVRPNSMALDDADGIIDFVFAFAAVHEMPSPAWFFVEAARAMKPGAALLLGERAGQVDDREFMAELGAAVHAGLAFISQRPLMHGSRTALLCKPFG